MGFAEHRISFQIDEEGRLPKELKRDKGISNNPAPPYQQISNWKSCNKTLSKQLQRLELLKN